ncbi:MAG: hypothetical protein WHS65_12790 [Melioribacteraceae bacterium]
MYLINGTEYKLKERYTLKEWGKILQIINLTPGRNENEIIINMLADDKLIDILNIILDKPVISVYEEDFETINKIIKDFFSRKNSLMKNINNSSSG